MLLLLCLAPAQVNAQTPVGIAVGGDNLTRLLWNNPDGSISLWRLDAYGGVASQTSYGPYTGWSGKSLATGTDNVSRILWTNTNGTAALWRINSDGSSPNTNYGPYSGWTAANVTVGGDNTSRLLWNNTSGQMAHWSVAANGTFTDAEYGPFTGYTAFQVAAGPNSVPRTLWNKSDGGISLWNSVYGDANYSYPDYGPFAGYSPVALAVDSNNAPRILWSYPSNRMVSLWRVAPDGTYTYRYYTNPNYNYFPVALAAGTGGDVRLLWSAGQGSALVWTIKADGTYTQTYTTVARAPQAVLVQVSPITITAGSTASGFINGIHPTTNGTTVYLSSDSPSVQVPYSVAVAANSYTVTFPVTTTAGTYDYTPATITALVNADPATKGTATVTVYTPSGTTTTGGGSPSGGSPSGGTGSGGTGTGGSGGTGTGGSGGTGTGGSGGTGTGGSGGVASYGHYDVTYSGGTITTQDGSGAGTVIPTTDSYGYSASARLVGNSDTTNSTSISAKLNGPLTAHLHWVADTGTNSPPPAQVSVTQTCTLNWSMSDYDHGVSGSYDTSFGQSGPIAVGTSSASSGSKTTSIATNGNTDLDVSWTPLLQVSGYVKSSCSYDLIGYRSTVTAVKNDVIINLDGYKTVNGAQEAMAGQQIKATLVGLPAGATVTSYTWSFDGGTFSNPIKNWDGNGTAPNGTPQQLFPFTPADLTGTDTTGNGLTVNPLNFYDQTTDTITVKCMVSLKLSDGTTKTVSAQSLPITFLKPSSSWTINPPDQPTGFFLDTSNHKFGINVVWKPVTISVPPAFPGGDGCFVQIITPSGTATRYANAGKPVKYSLQKPGVNPDGTPSWSTPTTGLDIAFPYPFGYTVNTDGTVNPTASKTNYTWAVASMGVSGDQPSQTYAPPDVDGGGINWYTATNSDSFSTWLMYKPSSANAIWVPLRKVAWSSNATVVFNGSQWLGNPDDAFPNPLQTKEDTPPQWTVINNLATYQMRPPP